MSAPKGASTKTGVGHARSTPSRLRAMICPMTGSVLLVARSQARRRWRALAALTIFVGLAGGLSLSLIGGSRRSSSVVDHYFDAARRYDLGLFGP